MPVGKRLSLACRDVFRQCICSFQDRLDDDEVAFLAVVSDLLFCIGADKQHNANQCHLLMLFCFTCFGNKPLEHVVKLWGEHV